MEKVTMQIFGEKIQKKPSAVSFVESNYSGVSIKKSASKFRAAKDKLVSKKIKRHVRYTLIGSNKKKNLAYYDKEIYKTLKDRKKAEVIYGTRNATPAPLTESDLVDIEENFAEDDKKQRAESLWDALIEKVWKPKTPRFTIYKNTSILFDIKDLDEVAGEELETSDLIESFESKTEAYEAQPDFISQVRLEKPKKIAKVLLNEDAFDFYEICSLTVPKGTKEAKELEKFNKNYAFITSAEGRRKTSTAETQTDNPLLKTRSVNCEVVIEKDEKNNVSNYDIFMTYQEVAGKKKFLEAGDAEVAETTPQKHVKTSEELLPKNENFHVSAMILERFCAENVFRSQQKRIFNLVPPDPLNVESAISYRMETLWSYHCFETMGKEVVSMSWCPKQHGLLAVAYGIYQYRDSKHRISGAVLIWNCKNPVNPERRYHYKQPVTAVEFCENSPQYLAVGLYDGSIEIIDITPILEKVVIAKTDRKSLPGIEPVWQIKWIREKGEDMLLTVGQDGRVIKLKIGSGPNLIGFPQVHLDRVDGIIEALPVEHKNTFIEGDHHSQGLCLQTHPLKKEIYLVGTDEGCIHVCSTKFPYQHTGVFQGHNGGVYSIEYSPFSPKVFLTAGGDCIVRVWIEGIFEPIIELSDGFSAIHSAYWSPTHPTIIAACTQESVFVWELLRKNPKPVTVKSFGNKQVTVFKFSSCGRSIVVGDNEGNTHVVALEEFPFPPRYPFKQLEKVLLNMVGEKLHLKQQIMNIGGLGYSKDKKIEK